MSEITKEFNSLDVVIKRRLILYYLYDYTLEEIAIKEHCSKVAIKYSLDIAIKNLKKINLHQTILIMKC